MLRYGYESTMRQLTANRPLYEAAFARHDVRVDAIRFASPWELTG